MKSVVIICLLMLAAHNSFGQEKLVGKGANREGVLAEYYLQTSTVVTKEDYREAVVRKVYADGGEARMLSFRVDCKAHKYIITKTTTKGYVFDYGSEEMSDVESGSTLEKVINAICKE